MTVYRSQHLYWLHKTRTLLVLSPTPKSSCCTAANPSTRTTSFIGVIGRENVHATDFSKSQNKRKTKVFLQTPDENRLFWNFEKSATGTFFRLMCGYATCHLQKSWTVCTCRGLCPPQELHSTHPAYLVLPEANANMAATTAATTCNTSNIIMTPVRTKIKRMNGFCWRRGLVQTIYKKTDIEGWRNNYLKNKQVALCAE